MSVVSADEAGSKSTETFTTALVLNAAIAGGEFVAFLVIRRWFPQIYQSRAELVEDDEKAKPLPKGFFSVIPTIITARDEDIIDANGLDAYLFVRFLRLMVVIFGPIAVISWAVLLPVFGTGSAGNQGLDQFTFGNIGRDQQARYAAPLILVWFSTFYILFIIKREYGIFVKRRQDFLTSRKWATTAQSRTVLVTGLPEDHCNIEALQALTSNVPGGVRKIWLARDLKGLDDVYDRRTDAVQKLEKAENTVIKLADKRVRKKKVDPNGNDNIDATEKMHDTPVLARYIPEKKRPTNRLGKIPFFGKKVDTINWATEEIETTTQELERERQDLSLSKFPAKSSAFILFNDQISAHMFAKGLSKEKRPLRMCGRFLNVDAEDVVWSNMSINPYAAKVRHAAMLAVTIAIIIFWSPLTAFVTSISNVSSLCSSVSWLSWLCTLPTPINGIIQGVLPPLVLILLFLLVPIIFRMLIRFGGTPLHSRVEHSLQKRYFAFLFVQGFIIATLASGIMAAISQITQNPSATVDLLANNLPGASVFFLTLVVTNGLTGAASGLLQVVRLAIYYVKVVLMGGSPRSLFNVTRDMPLIAYGKIFPGQSLYVVIALAYSTISPLVCGFALLTFTLWYISNKYLMLWVNDQADIGETAGLYYYTALNQIFAGLYIEHLCLIGLFFLARNTDDNLAALPEAILMIVLLVLTILVHLYLNYRTRPYVTYLPESMADEMNRNEERYAREMREEKRARGHKEHETGNPATRFQTNTTYAGGNGEAAPKHSQSIDGRPDFNAGNDKAYPNQSFGQNNEEAAIPHHASHPSMGGESEADELAGGLNEHTFHHPALWRPQPTIWLVKDDLGVSDEAVRNAKAHRIDATNEDTRFNEKGKIEIAESRKTLPGELFDQNL